MSKSKRILSVLAVLCLACCLFSGALYVSAMKADATECENDAVPSTALGLSTDYWGGARFTVTDLPDNGGIHYNWTDGAYEVRSGLTKAYALDGLHMRFANYASTEGAKVFNFYLCSSGTASDCKFGADSGRLCFALKEDGTVLLFTAGHGGGDKLTEGNAKLTYAALSAAPWDIKFEKNADGSLTMFVAGETLTISAAVMADAQMGDNVYLSFEAREAKKYSFDLVKLHSGDCEKQAPAPAELIDCEVAAPSTALGLSTDYWGGARFTVTDLPDNGGIHYNWTDGTYEVRSGLTKAFALDGLHMRFANYASTEGAKVFNFYLCSSGTASDCKFGADSGRLCFALTEDGTVLLFTAGHAGGDKLAEKNAKLSYEVLSAAPWDVTFKKNDDGSLAMTIAGVALTIPAATMTDAQMGDNGYLSFEAREAKKYSFDLVKLHDGECKTVTPPEPEKPQDPANPITREVRIPVINGDLNVMWGVPDWEVMDRTDDGIEIKGITRHGRVGYGGTVNLDGLRISLKKVNIPDDQVLTLSLGNVEGSWWDSNCLMFMLYNAKKTEAGADSPNGWMRIREYGKVQGDELIRPFAKPVFGTSENLTDIEIRFYKGTGGQWYICVNDEAFPFDIERAHLNDLDNAWVSFGTWDGKEAPFSYFVDTITCTKDEAQIFDVIDKIDAIGEVTLESEAAINEAEAAYGKLYKGLKPLVSNYAKLTAAKIDLEELKAAASDPGSSDPTPDKPESDDKPASDTSKPADNPDTGSALPVAGAVVAVLALGAVITLRKKAK